MLVAGMDKPDLFPPKTLRLAQLLAKEFGALPRSLLPEDPYFSGVPQLEPRPIRWAKTPHHPFPRGHWALKFLMLLRFYVPYSETRSSQKSILHRRRRNARS
jgi:hypothetical protein